MEEENIIDDLNEIESDGLLNDDRLLSNIYNVKIGGFGNKELVKTYLTTLTVNDLEKDISVYETLSKDKTWPVSQIIQREVDRIRVSNISKDYVLRKGRLVKYFPPLIVALLPKASDDTIALSLNYDKEKDDQSIKEYIYGQSNYRDISKLKKPFLDSKDVSLTDGLYLLEVSKVFDFNIFCWDKSKYYAVVIDGQHRLESLIKSSKQNHKIKNYAQDVVFIELSNLIKDLDNAISPVEVVRRVFVDINTNAKRVGIVRQILMDDKDLSSLLVQSLVDSVNRDGSSKNTDKYLRSQVVDWYGESLKHTLPHITGVLSLQQIINDYLLDVSMSSIDDMRSPMKVKKWVKNLNERLFVDRTIDNNTDYENIIPLHISLHDYDMNISLTEEIYEDDIESEYKETTLFEYDYNILEIAQGNFERMYSSSIIMFFNEFTPYKEAYKIIDENKGFDHTSTTCKALLSSKKKILSTDILKGVIATLKAKMEEELNKEYHILLTVLGQKTVFNILFKRILFGLDDTYNEDKIKSITRNYLKEINDILDKQINMPNKIFGKKEQFIVTGLSDALMDLGPIASQFWEGIIYENGKIIYNSQGIKSFYSFIEYLIRLNYAIKDKRQYPKFDDILFMKARIKRILKKRSNYEDSDLEKLVEEIITSKGKFIEKTLYDASGL